MSTRRVIASFTLSAAALAVAATFAIRSFPLEAQGQAAAEPGKPIQLVRGGEHLLHGELPEYPGRAIRNKAEGDVVVEMTLNDRGEVSDARVLSGPEDLRRATLEAVLRWHYSPAAMSSTSTQATLRFKVPEMNAEDLEKVEVYDVAVARSAEQHSKQAEIEVAPEKQESEHLATYAVALQGDHELASKSMHWKLTQVHPEPKFDGTAKLVGLRTERVPQATAREVLAQAGVSIGDALTEDSAKRIRQAALATDEHLTVTFHQDRQAGGVVVTIVVH